MNMPSAMRLALGAMSILLYTTTSQAADQSPKKVRPITCFDPRTTLFTPFIHYIKEGNFKDARHYKDSSMFSQFINWQDEEGRTPLWHAVDGGYDYMVKFLLESKADPTIADNKTITPLRLAQDKKLQEIVALLQPQK